MTVKGSSGGTLAGSTFTWADLTICQKDLREICVVATAITLQPLKGSNLRRGSTCETTDHMPTVTDGQPAAEAKPPLSRHLSNVTHFALTRNLTLGERPRGDKRRNAEWIVRPAMHR